MQLLKNKLDKEQLTVAILSGIAAGVLVDYLFHPYFEKVVRRVR